MDTASSSAQVETVPLSPEQEVKARLLKKYETLHSLSYNDDSFPGIQEIRKVHHDVANTLISLGARKEMAAIAGRLVDDSTVFSDSKKLSPDLPKEELEKITNRELIVLFYTAKAIYDEKTTKGIISSVTEITKADKNVKKIQDVLKGRDLA